MKTRRFNLAPEHVMALNSVQVDFYGNSEIDTAYRKYRAHLNIKAESLGDEKAELFFQEREDMLYDLLHAIGDCLGYKYDKRDLAKLSYGPEGWVQDEQTLRVMRSLLVDVLSGKRPLPIGDWQAIFGSRKFPPPPTD